MLELIDSIYKMATLWNLWLVIAGTTIGIIGGALPGITTTLGIALLTSITFSMGTEDALLMLMCLYVGSVYGGSMTAVTINIPGTPASAATALDGYPLACRGEAGPALGLARVGSFIGSILGIFCLSAITPLLSAVSLRFSSVEFFLFAVLGVVACGSLYTTDIPVKGWIMGFLGLLVATIGLDEIHAYPRYSFGIPNLMGGIAFIPVMIGMFGIPEVITIMSRLVEPQSPPINLSVTPKYREFIKRFRLVLQSAAIGVGIGIIPGVGEDIASWSAYAAAKRTSKHPEEFGKGAYEGVIASEVANNACVGGAIIPLLALGIPGSAPAAILLGAMFLHGLRPGPLFLTEQPHYLYYVSSALIYASFAILILGLIISRWILIYIVRLPQKLMMGIVAPLCVVGAYSLNLSLFDVMVMLGFGVFGTIMRRYEYPAAPFVLGMVLGPMADGNLRRAILISGGDPTVFVTRPAAAVLTAIIVIFIATQFELPQKLYGQFKKYRSRGTSPKGIDPQSPHGGKK
jgi:putative tricarboxylic transport membrane protein